MLNLNKFFRINATLLAIALVATQSVASEPELCEAFKNSNIDQSMIETMLNAAENDHLYRMKQNSSKMGFCVDSSIGQIEGSFNNFQGGLALKDSDSQTMVSIDVNSLTTDAFFIEELLKGDSFFDAEKFPELIFISTGFEWISDTRAILKGHLSMHGITKAIGFYVEITETDGDLGDSDSIHIKATTTILRSEFGMSSLSSMVDDKVNLCMSAEAERYNKKHLSLSSTSINGQL